MATISRADLRQIPPIPAVCSRVMELATDARATATDVASVVGSDPRMSLQLLRVANSALLRGRQSVSSVSEAIVRIGMDETMRVAIACALLIELEQPRLAIGFEAVLPAPRGRRTRMACSQPARRRSRRAG